MLSKHHYFHLASSGALPLGARAPRKLRMSVSDNGPRQPGMRARPTRPGAAVGGASEMALALPPPVPATTHVVAAADRWRSGLAEPNHRSATRSTGERVMRDALGRPDEVHVGAQPEIAKPQIQKCRKRAARICMPNPKFYSPEVFGSAVLVFWCSRRRFPTLPAGSLTRNRTQRKLRAVGDVRTSD